jgi:hypothetical protein
MKVGSPKCSIILYNLIRSLTLTRVGWKKMHGEESRKEKCDGEMSNIVAREYHDTSLASPEDSDVIYTIQRVRLLCAMPMPSVLLLESNSAATSCHPDPTATFFLA